MEWCLFALDKAPDFIQVGSGDIILRLLVHFFLLVTVSMPIEACSNLNLCYILGPVIKGSVKSTLDEYSKYQLSLAEEQDLLDEGSCIEKSLRVVGKGV